MKHKLLFAALAMFITGVALAGPKDSSKQGNSQWWWENQWWNKGIIKQPSNHRVSIKNVSYKSGKNEIPALLIRPVKPGKYYPVLFQHGRRGLGALVRRHAIRLAARGFVVLAPDIYKGNFIDNYPLKHDYKLEKDVDRAVDVLMRQKGIRGKKACIYSHTRGGYYALKVAVRFKRQQKELACYISYYPHLQDPNAPEPMQVYFYAPEIDKLTLPTLIFIGDQEQYQRRRVIESSVKAMQEKIRFARLIIYPGVGRGFDFRPPHVRTFADDLASKDAIQRAARFIRRHLRK